MPSPSPIFARLGEGPEVDREGRLHRIPNSESFSGTKGVGADVAVSVAGVGGGGLVEDEEVDVEVEGLEAARCMNFRLRVAAESDILVRAF